MISKSCFLYFHLFSSRRWAGTRNPETKGETGKEGPQVVVRASHHRRCVFGSIIVLVAFKPIHLQVDSTIFGHCRINGYKYVQEVHQAHWLRLRIVRRDRLECWARLAMCLFCLSFLFSWRQQWRPTRALPGGGGHVLLFLMFCFRFPYENRYKFLSTPETSFGVTEETIPNSLPCQHFCLMKTTVDELMSP